MPTHASRLILSSCNPGLASPVPVPSVGMVTPSDGGTNPGGGALIAEGAMRDCRMCASDERMATCIDCKVGIVTTCFMFRGRTQGGGREKTTYIQSLKVFAHFEHELLGAFLSLGEVVVGPVRLWQREERYGRRSEGEQASNVLRGGSFG